MDKNYLQGLGNSSMPTLEVVQGNLPYASINIDSYQFTIGRARENSLQVRDDNTVSRQHCTLRGEGGVWYIQDNASRSGTFVNGQPVQNARLNSGDQLRIGETIFTFRWGAQASAGSPEYAATVMAPEPPAYPAANPNALSPAPQYNPQPQYGQPPAYNPQPAYNQPPAYNPQPQYGPPQYPPPPQYVPVPVMAVPYGRPYYAPSKSRGTAVTIEVVGGLLGFMGIGWLYAGCTGTGIAWLIGWWVWNTIAATLDVFTAGIFLCIHLPINIMCWIWSPMALSSHCSAHPEIFG